MERTPRTLWETTNTYVGRSEVVLRWLAGEWQRTGRRRQQPGALPRPGGRRGFRPAARRFTWCRGIACIGEQLRARDSGSSESRPIDYAVAG